MAEVIMMKHPQTGVIKKGFIGFSWTVFFFGWLAMVFRGDVILGICIFLAEIASLVAVDLQYIIWQLLLLSLVQILFAFTYNKSYTSRLIKKGFRFSDSDVRNQLGAAALGMPLEACVLAPQANTTGTSQPATATESLTKASDAAEGNLPKVALPSDDGKGIRNLIIISLLVVAVIVVLIKRDDLQSSLDVDKGDPVSTTSKDEKIKVLETFSGASDISPSGELYEIFKFNSQYTDVQRENRLAELKGKVVSWECTVHEVNKIGDRRYTVTPTSGDGRVDLILKVTARNEEEARYIESLMTGSPFAFIGMFNGEDSMRSLILDPVVLAQPLGQQAAEQQGNGGSHLPKTSEADRKKRTLEAATTPDEKIKALEDFSELSGISPVGELYEVFKFNSQYTDIQRENRLASLKGQVVNWDCTVYEVSKTGDRRYLINSTPGNGRVGLILNVIARNDAEAQYIENLMTGSPLTFIGMFNGEMFMRSLILDPVILAQPLGQQAAKRQGGDGTGLVRAGAKKDASAVVPQPGEYSIREEGVSGKITLARPDDTGRYPVSIATWNNDERGSTCDFEGFCSIKDGMLICPSEGMAGEDSDENHMAIKILKHGLEVVHEAPYLCGLGASMKGLYLPD